MSDNITISTFQLFQLFPDQVTARKYLETRLWPNGTRCPHCGLTEHVTARKNGYYRCNQCREDFTVRTGTIFERVGGFPMQKKVADKGVDGRLYFEAGKSLKEMVLSVKSGNVRPTDIRDLRGVLEREENAELAGFLCIKEPSKAMHDEAARAGMYEYSGVSYPRIQLLTVHDILEDHHELYTPTKVGSRIATGQIALDLRAYPPK